MLEKSKYLELKTMLECMFNERLVKIVSLSSFYETLESLEFICSRYNTTLKDFIKQQPYEQSKEDSYSMAIRTASIKVINLAYSDKVLKEDPKKSMVDIATHLLKRSNQR